MNRCSGHCCRAFTINAPHADILDLRKEIPNAPPDFEMIRWMVYPLGLRDVAPDGTPLDPPAMYYGCRNFDEASGDCKDYFNRPRMCREYPYGQRCQHPECTMEQPTLVQIAESMERKAQDHDGTK